MCVHLLGAGGAANGVIAVRSGRPLDCALLALCPDAWSEHNGPVLANRVRCDRTRIPRDHAP